MILIHIIYIPFYYLFRPLRHSFFDSDSFASAFISFYVGFSTSMIYDQTIADGFSKKIRGAILVTSIILTYIFLTIAYWRKDISMDIVKKYKSTLLLGLVIDISWTVLVVHYIITNF